MKIYQIEINLPNAEGSWKIMLTLLFDLLVRVGAAENISKKLV